MRYAACNELVEERSFAESCDLLARCGFEGVEIAPFTLSDDPRAIDAAAAKRVRRSIREAGLACAGLHWLLRAPPGLHLAHPEPGTRSRSWEVLRSLIELCAELDGDVLVLGSGKQRGETDGVSAGDAYAVLRDGLGELAMHCERAGVSFLVEPLPARITGVINTLEQAESLVSQIGNPCVASMFDFHNCEDETSPWDRLIKTHAGVIRHVHLNDKAGKAPSLSALSREERVAFVAAFEALRAADYGGWVSLEVFNVSASAELVLRETRRFLSWVEGERAR